MKKRLGVLATHPVQYTSQLFRVLAAAPEIELTVYYAMRPDAVQQGAGFGVAFQWDRDLTGGYPHVWLANRARRPDLLRADGCDTPDIAGILEKEAFDGFLVLGWDRVCYRQAIAAAGRTGTPLFVRGDSTLGNDAFWPKRAVKKLVYPALMKKFSAALAPGRLSEAYFRYYGARRVISCPHFVDNAFFEAGAASHRARPGHRRDRFGIPDGSTVYLFAGKMVDYKHPMHFLKAVAALRASDPGLPVFVLLAGDGPERAALEMFARRQALPACFTGFLNQTEISAAYAAADALVLPSDARETWGLVVNEAMASGLPAVVSDRVGSAPDLVEDGVTGHTYRFGEIADMKHKMLRLTDASVRGRMSERARQRVSGYTAEAAARGVLLALSEAGR